MKKRIISTMVTLTLCFATVWYFKIPKLPTVPNITNSITLPTINIPSKYFENIKVVL